MEGLFFSKTTLSEWTGLNVLTLARSDSGKIHLFNYGRSREQYILRSQLSMGDLRLLSGPSLKEVAFWWSHCYCRIICRQNKFVSGVITHTKDQGRPQNGRLSRSFSKQGHFTFLSKSYGSRNGAKEAYACLHTLAVSMWDWIKCCSYFIILSWLLQYLLLIQNHFFKNVDF